MSSMQFGFYHTPADVVKIVDFMVNEGYEAYFQRIWHLDQMKFDVNVSSEAYWSIGFVHRDYLASITYRYIETQGYYLMDFDKTCGIEFNLAEVKDSRDVNNILNCGRFYFKKTYYESNAIHSKNASFVSLVSKLYSKIKKKFFLRSSINVSPNSLEYMTEEISRLIENGGIEVKQNALVVNGCYEEM